MPRHLGRIIKRVAKIVLVISTFLFILSLLMGSWLYPYALILLILIAVGMIPLYVTGIVIEKLEQTEVQNRAILELLEKQAPSDKQS